MARNTAIRTSQVEEDAITKTKINADVAGDGLTQAAGGELDVNVDDFTMKLSNNQLKIADRIELNTMLNAFRIAINGSLSQFNMVDGITDEFEDETGIDTGASTNEDYDSTNDLYKPLATVATELDYMEYATDGAAQAAYVSSSIENFTTYTEVESDNKLTVIANKITAVDYFDSDVAYVYIDKTLDYFDALNIKFEIQIESSSDEGAKAGICLSTGIGDMGAVATNVSVLLNKEAGGYRFYLARGWVAFDTGEYIISAGTTYYCHLERAAGNDTVTLKVYSDAAMTTQVDNTFSLAGFGTVKWRYFYGINRRTSVQTLGFDGFIQNVSLDGFALQCYSEDTETQQGTYSLKVEAAQTGSLNDTLTKSGLSIDLSGINTLKYDIYSEDRTGSHIKIAIHDSGGTTTEHTANISSTGAWEEQTIDLSGVADVNKDDIDSIIITIDNADAANTFYVDNFYAPGITNDMTLISNSETAETEPDIARIVIFEEDVDSITENTDIKAYVTKDGGSTYAQVTLTDEGDYQSGKRILTGTVDLTQSGIGSGTSIEFKIETLNNKLLKLHGVGLLWD